MPRWAYDELNVAMTSPVLTIIFRVHELFMCNCIDSINYRINGNGCQDMVNFV